MPPRRQQQAIPPPEEDEHKRKIPLLVGDVNYNSWEKKVKHYFYSRSWEAITTAADYDKNEDIPEEKKEALNEALEAISAADKRKAWGALTLSLSEEILARVDDVALGDSVALLRTIRGLFYRNTVYTKSLLKERLQSSRLEEFDDLEGLISFVEVTSKRLLSLGYPMPEEDKQHYLLRSLPEAYDAAKTTIKPR